ncbi:MAG: hypothetical protein WCF03_20860 [Nitrososphaeraceae archaeon]
MKNKQDKGKKIIRTGLEVNGENICRIEEAEGESDNKNIQNLDEKEDK